MNQPFRLLRKHWHDSLSFLSFRRFPNQRRAASAVLFQPALTKSLIGRLPPLRSSPTRHNGHTIHELPPQSSSPRHTQILLCIRKKAVRTLSRRRNNPGVRKSHTPRHFPLSFPQSRPRNRPGLKQLAANGRRRPPDRNTVRWRRRHRRSSTVLPPEQRRMPCKTRAGDPRVVCNAR